MIVIAEYKTQEHLFDGDFDLVPDIAKVEITQPKTWEAAKNHWTDIELDNWETLSEVICRDSDEWIEDEMYAQYMEYFDNDLTKRIIWAWNETEDAELSVFIGPEEETEGQLSDFFEIYPLLEQMFPLPGVVIGDAESLHTFSLYKLAEAYSDFPRDYEAQVREVMEYIALRLERANAVDVNDE